MEFYIKKLLSSFIIPPVSLIWLSVFIILFSKKFKIFGRILAILCLLMALALSTPYISSRIKHFVEYPEVLKNISDDVQAIVVLGCGIAAYAPEYDGPSPRSCLLERVRYGAYLFDKTGLPILFSGGDPHDLGVSEAQVMKAFSESELLTPVTWLESQSKDTFENAQNSFDILSKENKTKIYLVTHSYHMKRAKALFDRAGFAVVPAPTVFTTQRTLEFLNLIPNGWAFKESYQSFKELFGRIWYSVRY